jgi:hypothetical protein
VRSKESALSESHQTYNELSVQYEEQSRNLADLREQLTDRDRMIRVIEDEVRSSIP